MNLTALYDQTVGLYPILSSVEESERQTFMLALAKVYYEAGWELVDESKNYKELRSAARKKGYHSLDKYLQG